MDWDAMRLELKQSGLANHLIEEKINQIKSIMGINEPKLLSRPSNHSRPPSLSPTQQQSKKTIKIKSTKSQHLKKVALMEKKKISDPGKSFKKKVNPLIKYHSKNKSSSVNKGSKIPKKVDDNPKQKINSSDSKRINSTELKGRKTPVQKNPSLREMKEELEIHLGNIEGKSPEWVRETWTFVFMNDDEDEPIRRPLKNISNERSVKVENTEYREPTPFADSKADNNLKISAEIRRRMVENKKQPLKGPTTLSVLHRPKKIGYEIIFEETEDQLRRERAIPRYGQAIICKINDCVSYKPTEQKLMYRSQRAIEYGFITVRTIDTSKNPSKRSRTLSNPRNTLECAETGSLNDLKVKNDLHHQKVLKNSEKDSTSKKRKAKDKQAGSKKPAKEDKRGSRRSIRLSSKPRINYSEMDI
ncbi:DgyrCDS13147 [Dimorphilus gyrociliatus]|uniref:DgyrCDS13147 n=1 Tax=Dimorphilus gyrociliatus TaxID=2664684 RepID=A0A7I8W9V8_9ANNE|nr:DgyrCDS13147 [Dimorphilus gyrociliatus]